jgi:hypothetical protein
MLLQPSQPLPYIFNFRNSRIGVLLEVEEFLENSEKIVMSLNIAGTQ